MIRRINLYMFRQILTAFLFSGLAVTFVVLFTQSFRMMSFVIDNSSTLWVFLELMGLMVPTFLPLIVPISAGIGILFIYHKLAVDSEIVVLRAAGFSPLRLAAPALTLASLIVVAGFLLTLWIAPAANRSLVQLQYKVRDDFSAFMIRLGAFNDLSQGLTFFARRRGPEGSLEDILVHDVRHPEQPVTIMAERGRFLAEGGVPQVAVFNGRRQELDTRTGRLQELHFDSYVLDLHLLRAGGANRRADPREMAPAELWQASLRQDDGDAPKTKGNLRAEIHQRLGGPLLALTFAFIAVTVILVGDFNRRGMTGRVFGAALAIVVVQGAMIALVNQVSKSPYVAPLLYLVILLPIPVCLLLLRGRQIPFWPKARAL